MIKEAQMVLELQSSAVLPRLWLIRITGNNAHNLMTRLHSHHYTRISGGGTGHHTPSRHWKSPEFFKVQMPDLQQSSLRKHI